MSYRRALIRALDRPGGRSVLGAVINRLARRYAPGVRVCFRNGMWMHQENWVTFVDSPTLDYHPSIFSTWANEMEAATVNATECWFYVYKPSLGDLIIDAGAGKGEDTIAFSKVVGPTGKVLSIEAHPITFRCLRLFCELNNLHNVTASNFAIIDGTRPMAIESQKGWQANRVVPIDTKDSIRVPGLSLDELVERENIRRVDFLKMNIEGAEALAVEWRRRSESRERCAFHVMTSALTIVKANSSEPNGSFKKPLSRLVSGLFRAMQTHAQMLLTK